MREMWCNARKMWCNDIKHKKGHMVQFRVILRYMYDAIQVSYGAIQRPNGTILWRNMLHASQMVRVIWCNKLAKMCSMVQNNGIIVRYGAIQRPYGAIQIS